MTKLSCINTDVCLPDYFSGDSRPWITIPIYRGMTLKQIKDSLHSEIDQDAVGGNINLYDMNDRDLESWYSRSHAAINRIKPEIKNTRRFFMNLEDTDKNDEFSDSVHAYFVFIEE